jgi:hypothetical protein
MVKLDNPVSIKSALLVTALALLFTVGAQKVIASCCGDGQGVIGQRAGCVGLTSPYCGGYCVRLRCQYQFIPSPLYNYCSYCSGENDCTLEPNYQLCCFGGI